MTTMPSNKRPTSGHSSRLQIHRCRVMQRQRPAIRQCLRIAVDSDDRPPLPGQASGRDGRCRRRDRAPRHAESRCVAHHPFRRRYDRRHFTQRRLSYRVVVVTGNGKGRYQQAGFRPASIAADRRRTGQHGRRRMPARRPSISSCRPGRLHLDDPAHVRRAQGPAADRVRVAWP